MTRKTFNRASIYILLSLIYYFFLNYVYVNYVINIFKYVGYEYVPNIYKILEGFLLYLGLAILLSTLKDLASSSAIDVFFFLSVAPFIILYQYESFNRWMVLYMAAMTVLLYLCLRFFYSFRAYRFNGESKDLKRREFINEKTVFARKNSFNWKNIIFLLVIVFFLYLFVTNGMPDFSMLSFSQINEVRAESSFSTIAEIVMNAMGRIVIPILFSIYLKEKSYAQLTLLTIIQLYLFSITGFKTYLFVLVLVLLMPLARKFPIRYVPVLGICAALVAVVFLYEITGNNMGLALIADRVVFFPAKIKWAYLDFFSQNTFVQFSENLFAQILGITPVYSSHTHFMIGGLYFNKPEMWANSGYLADAYANLGWLGGVIITLALSIELYFIDKATNYDSASIAAAIFFIFYIALNDGALIYVSGSGGLLLAIIIIDFLRRRKVM